LYSRLPIDIDQVIWLFCPDILVLVLLPILIHYFNRCARACSLGIAAQIKIMGESLLVFTGLWSVCDTYGYSNNSTNTVTCCL
jgi:hypothetical protein